MSYDRLGFQSVRQRRRTGDREAGLRSRSRSQAGAHHRLAAADGVTVGQVQPQRVDRLIALQVWLLVHGPLHRAGLDLGDLRGVGVEGVQLRGAVRGGDGLDGDERDRPSRGDARVLTPPSSLEVIRAGYDLQIG